MVVLVIFELRLDQAHSDAVGRSLDPSAARVRVGWSEPAQGGNGRGAGVEVDEARGRVGEGFDRPALEATRCHSRIARSGMDRCRSSYPSGDCADQKNTDRHQEERGASSEPRRAQAPKQA